MRPRVLFWQISHYWSLTSATTPTRRVSTTRSWGVTWRRSWKGSDRCRRSWVSPPPRGPAAQGSWKRPWSMSCRSGFYQMFHSHKTVACRPIRLNSLLHHWCCCFLAIRFVPTWTRPSFQLKTTFLSWTTKYPDPSRRLTLWTKGLRCARC